MPRTVLACPGYRVVIQEWAAYLEVGDDPILFEAMDADSDIINVTFRGASDSSFIEMRLAEIPGKVPSPLWSVISGVYLAGRLVCDLPAALNHRRQTQPVQPGSGDTGSIMEAFDRWVAVRRKGGYLPPDLGLDEGIIDWRFAVLQVRAELWEFVELLQARGLKGAICEVGLGYYGGTHVLWRHVFEKVVSVDCERARVARVRLSERLDGRSRFVVGKSQSPRTLEAVRQLAAEYDVVFLDGDHTYATVKDDWSRYRCLVRSGGLLAFHDSQVRGVPGVEVYRFLEDLRTGRVDGRIHILHDIVHSRQGITYEVI